VKYPTRIVCLTEETTETLYLLGQGDRVVGVSGYTVRPPEARLKPKVSAFINAKFDRIEALRPDLVLAFSDLQADITRELVAAGVTVLCTNQRSIDDILQAILLVGGALEREGQARDVAQDMRDEIRQIREYSSIWPDRPRVYFEEWMDPLIAGIRWVSETIELAGGRDVFAELRDQRSAKGRVVDPAEGARRDPEIILASWCGKPVDAVAIAARPGWDRVSAVRNRQIHELDGADVLSPGPSLMIGLRRIHEIVQAAQTTA